MKQNIVVQDVKIGEGIPKICTPLTGETVEELLMECKLALEAGADLVEWRVDFFQYALDIKKVLQALTKLKENLRGMPLLFSFRTAAEGGEKEIAVETYFALNKAVLESGNIDLIDIELLRGVQVVSALIKLAKENNVYTVVSNHNFEATPSKDEILSIIKQTIDLGADIPKIAVMPLSEEDVLTVFAANLQLKREYVNQPFIVIAMGKLGVISRMSGEIFGSALTFAVASKASAPGQVSIQQLKGILQLVHEAK